MMSRKNRVDSKKYAIKGDKLTQLLLISVSSIRSTTAVTPYKLLVRIGGGRSINVT